VLDRALPRRPQRRTMQRLRERLKRCILSYLSLYKGRGLAQLARPRPARRPYDAHRRDARVARKGLIEATAAWSWRRSASPRCVSAEGSFTDRRAATHLQAFKGFLRPCRTHYSSRTTFVKDIIIDIIVLKRTLF